MLTMVLPALLGTAFAIQPPGAFHAGEPVARNQETWLALQVHGAAASLVATPVIVRAVEDPLMDAPGERSGVEVTSVDVDGVVAFVRGATLHAGSVDVAQVSEHPDAHLAPQPYVIGFRGLSHRIERSCEPEPIARVDGQAHYACSVLLRSLGTRQVLARMIGYREPGSEAMAYGDDGKQRLLFAGDLDRDGKLDLIFDTSDHYNQSRPTLFLSTGALDGAPLGEAAHHEATGC